MYLKETHAATRSTNSLRCSLRDIARETPFGTLPGSIKGINGK